MCIYKTGGKVYKCSTEEMMILSLCILALSLSLASSQHCPLMDCASDRIDISNQDEERFLRSITCQDYCIRQVTHVQVHAISACTVYVCIVVHVQMCVCVCIHYAFLLPFYFSLFLL